MFWRLITAACPVFATGEFIFRSGAHLNMSLLTLPLSEDGTAVNKSISMLAARLSAFKRTAGLRDCPSTCTM
jgi:hypothetical protein